MGRRSGATSVRRSSAPREPTLWTDRESSKLVAAPHAESSGVAPSGPLQGRPNQRDDREQSGVEEAIGHKGRPNGSQRKGQGVPGKLRREIPSGESRSDSMSWRDRSLGTELLRPVPATEVAPQAGERPTSCFSSANHLCGLSAGDQFRGKWEVEPIGATAIRGTLGKKRDVLLRAHPYEGRDHECLDGRSAQCVGRPELSTLDDPVDARGRNSCSPGWDKESRAPRDSDVDDDRANCDRESCPSPTHGFA